MGKLTIKLPVDVQYEINYIEKNFEKIFGGMTRAGAEEVVVRVAGNLPTALKNNQSFVNCVGLTKTYKTPTDDGINTKVIISGYFFNRKGDMTPAPLVANMFEYGSSKREYPKHPFFRRSFSKQAIKKVMLEEQKRLSQGILDE